MSHSKYIRVLDEFYDKNYPEFIALRTKVCGMIMNVKFTPIAFDGKYDTDSFIELLNTYSK